MFSPDQLGLGRRCHHPIIARFAQPGSRSLIMAVVLPVVPTRDAWEAALDEAA
jgi:hypothetical protein